MSLSGQNCTIIILLLVVRVIAAPVETSAADSTQVPAFVGYVSEPNVRGTTSLVVSCILTLILCVWSALHLNVPEQDSSRVFHIIQVIRWIITGVYAPELVVFTAWRQWASARLLGKQISELAQTFKKNHAATTASESQGQTTASLKTRAIYKSVSFADHRHRWTRTYDFFASTGGFAFDMSASGGSKIGHFQFFT